MQYSFDRARRGVKNTGTSAHRWSRPRDQALLLADVTLRHHTLAASAPTPLLLTKQTVHRHSHSTLCEGPYSTVSTGRHAM